MGVQKTQAAEASLRRLASLKLWDGNAFSRSGQNKGDFSPAVNEKRDLPAN